MPETIECILNQDYPEIEYIIIDDGSTDNTREVVQAYAGKLRYHYQENGGEAAAVNTGWQLATGDYFCVVCSDDPQKNATLIREMVEAMQAHPQIIVAYPDFYVIDAAGNVIRTIITQEFTPGRLLYYCECLPGPGALIRRSVLYEKQKQLRNPEYHFITDLESWMQLLRFGDFQRVPGVFAHWRAHPGGITSNVKNTRTAEELLKLKRQVEAAAPLPQLNRRRLACGFYFKAGYYSLWESPKIGLGYLLRSFVYSPIWFMRTMLRYLWKYFNHLPKRLAEKLLRTGARAMRALWPLRK